MMSSDLQEGGPADSGGMEAIAENIFTRPRFPEIDLEGLQATAFELFHGKKKRLGVLEGEVRELGELVEMIALVIGKTYVERGDSYVLADDNALTLIRDLLLTYNPTIIARNRNKRLPKH